MDMIELRSCKMSQKGGKSVLKGIQREIDIDDEGSVFSIKNIFNCCYQIVRVGYITMTTGYYKRIDDYFGLVCHFVQTQRLGRSEKF